MPHPAFGDDLIGKLAYLFGGALQYHGLYALFMIQMGVRCGDRQVMVVVLNAHQALGQFPFVMVVHVRQIGDAEAFAVASFAAVLQVRAQDIAHGFTARRIASFLDQFIKGSGEGFRGGAGISDTGISGFLAGHNRRVGVHEESET